MPCRADARQAGLDPLETDVNLRRTFPAMFLPLLLQAPIACKSGTPAAGVSAPDAAAADSGYGTTGKCIWTEGGGFDPLTPEQTAAVAKVEAALRVGLTDKELGYVIAIRYGEIPEAKLAADPVLAKVLDVARANGTPCQNGALSSPSSYGRRFGALKPVCGLGPFSHLNMCDQAISGNPTVGKVLQCLAWAPLAWAVSCQPDAGKDPKPQAEHADPEAYDYSPKNLGCDPPCPGNSTCDAASNKCTCLPNTAPCGEFCINTVSDRWNCNGCGKTCGLGEDCKDSQCISNTTCGDGKCEPGEATSCPKDCSKCVDGVSECVLNGTSVNTCVSGQWQLSPCALSEQCKCSGAVCACAVVSDVDEPDATGDTAQVDDGMSSDAAAETADAGSVGVPGAKCNPDANTPFCLNNTPYMCDCIKTASNNYCQPKTYTWANFDGACAGDVPYCKCFANMSGNYGCGCLGDP